MELSKIKKAIYIICLLFIVVSCRAQSKLNGGIETNLLTPKHQETTEIVSTVNQKLSKFINKEKTVFVFYTYKSKGISVVKATIFSKSDFGWFLRDTKVKPYGFFEYQNIPVVVFGESSDMFFTKTNQVKTFDWLIALPPLKEDVIYIPPHFDAPTWRYEFSNGKFDFKATEYWEYEK